jgi:hypothetical protein
MNPLVVAALLIHEPVGAEPRETLCFGPYGLFR